MATKRAKSRTNTTRPKPSRRMPARKASEAHDAAEAGDGVDGEAKLAEKSGRARDGAPGGEPEAKLGKVLGFMRLVWGLDHSLQSASKRMAAKIGVTGLQRLVIRIVGRYPDVSAGKLASILQVHPSTLTGVFDKLVQRGAIRRIPDPRDARRVLLELTAKGHAIDGVRTGTVEAAVRRALGSVSESQIEAAEAVLEALIRELDADV